MDLCIIIMSILAIICQFGLSFAGDFLSQKIKENPGNFLSFDLIISWDSTNSMVLLILIFLFNMRMLKLLQFSPKLSLFTAVIGKLRESLPGFFVLISLILLAFNQLFFLIFFSRVAEYKTFIQSSETILQVLLGTDFSFNFFPKYQMRDYLMKYLNIR